MNPTLVRLRQSSADAFDRHCRIMVADLFQDGAGLRGVMALDARAQGAKSNGAVFGIELQRFAHKKGHHALILN
jgi:hypothetical protein